MPSYRVKSAKYKRKNAKKRLKRIFRNSLFWFILSGVLVAAVLSYFLLFSRFLAIEEVKVKGGEIEREFLNEIKGKNLILFNKNKNSQKFLSRFLIYKTIDFEKKFPKTLKISLSKREEAAAWRGEQGFVLIDGGGVAFKEIFASASSSISEIKIINKELLEWRLGERVLEKEKLEKILELKKGIASILGPGKIKKVELSEERVDFTIEEVWTDGTKNKNWELFFNLEKNPEEAITKLRLLLDRGVDFSKLDYIDLRFSKVYYK